MQQQIKCFGEPIVKGEPISDRIMRINKISRINKRKLNNSEKVILDKFRKYGITDDVITDYLDYLEATFDDLDTEDTIINMQEETLRRWGPNGIYLKYLTK